MGDLTHVDYAILAYLDKHGSADKTKLNKGLGKKIASLDYRIDVLTSELPPSNVPVVRNWYVNKEVQYDTSSSGAGKEMVVVYSLSDLGKAALQDYRINKKIVKINSLFNSVWCPLMVSFITTVFLNYLLPVLVSLLECWLKSLL